jgi:serine/threonine protein kinase
MRTVDIREQEIFLEAIEIASPIARLDYVFQACGDNINLRDRVQQLLSLQNNESFILDREVTLDQAGNIRTDQSEVSDLTGVTVGKYHLVRQIGSGGMGDVYLAEQKEPIRRRVAVKVIKLGLDTKSFIARFNAERQALAVMDHRGITKVYDAGSTATGRPYFVMELVSGEDITLFCDDSRLNLEQRLSIFGELCKAIQHAHQKGLIHRDLKPSNILVSKKDGEFVSKVIDFGVSKATHSRVPGQTDLTRLACMIGTPDYMSPEQTDTQGNDQDIRTDIYSLGAVLYELLTGSTTFELEGLKQKNLLSIREIIQTRAVEAPSSRVAKLVDSKPQVFRDRGLEPKELASALRGNLDAIVLKCLAKDRAERYPSIAELAADLERHMNGDHVTAVRPSPIAYYVRQFKKHKWLLSISSAVVTLLLVISFISLRSANNATRFAEKAIEAEGLAKQRLNQLVVARRDAQLEKSKSQSFEKRYWEKEHTYRNEGAVIAAIIDFNQLRLNPGEFYGITISPWLRSQLAIRFENKIAYLVPVSKKDTSILGDTVLLRSIEEMQRIEFGPTSELLAETLDLLGEKYLNSGRYDLAIDTLRNSLYIHTENDKASEQRLRAMILLSKSLKLNGASSEAESYLPTIRRNLEKLPADSRLHGLVSELEAAESGKSQ